MIFSRASALRALSGTLIGVTTWFSADLHLGHVNIVSYCGRPYADVGLMNEDLARRFSERVSPQDTLVLLGDVAMGRLDETVPLLAQFPGRLVLVPGNHDKCWAGRGAKAEGAEGLYLSVFDEIWHEPAPFELASRRTLMSHFPFRGSGDHTAAERYSEFRPVDQGEWLLHGHVHNLWRQRGRMVNVGVDAWGGFPVSEHELAALVSAGPADLDCLEWVASAH